VHALGEVDGRRLAEVERDAVRVLVAPQLDLGVVRLEQGVDLIRAAELGPLLSEAVLVEFGER